MNINESELLKKIDELDTCDTVKKGIIELFKKGFGLELKKDENDFEIKIGDVVARNPNNQYLGVFSRITVDKATIIAHKSGYRSYWGGIKIIEYKTGKKYKLSDVVNERLADWKKVEG